MHHMNRISLGNMKMGIPKVLRAGWYNVRKMMHLQGEWMLTFSIKIKCVFSLSWQCLMENNTMIRFILLVIKHVKSERDDQWQRQEY